MKLEGLSELYKQMRRDGETRSKIEYVHGVVGFDVIFLIDETPFCLMFGAKGHNVSFEFEVGPGFSVTPNVPNDAYRALCKALGLTYNAGNPFSIKSFLGDFSARIPYLLATKRLAQPHEVARHRRDVEESEKVYFCGWRDNTRRGEHVTPKNLHKTRRLLGEAIYQSCKEKNISTCWTDQASDVMNIRMT